MNRLRRVTSCGDRPNWEGLDSTALTDSTRSARSSAREDRALSRSERADASSGEEALVARERMRRYEVKRGRVD